jgi:hypothetical protein
MLVSVSAARTLVRVLGWRVQAIWQLTFSFAAILQYTEKKGDVYNILWALVFGFATINILGLVTKRLEPSRTRMNFGETLAVMVVVVSVFLLGWEMLYVFHILPIQLQQHD